MRKKWGGTARFSHRVQPKRREALADTEGEVAYLKAIFSFYLGKLYTQIDFAFTP